MKILKFFLGITLIPFCISLTFTTYHIFLNNINYQTSFNWKSLSFLLSFIISLIILINFPRPTRLYILAHELTHALWAILMGGRVNKIYISKSNGYVKLSKSNFWITLAPYFFPFYTFIFIFIYWFISIFLNVNDYNVLWFSGVGLTWGFHIFFTIEALMQKQSDITENGRVFSYTIIYSINILLINIWIVIFKPLTIKNLYLNIYNDALYFYQKILNLI